MDSLFIANLTSPPLLFFLLGLSAALFRTDLEIPEPVAKLLSIYLLTAIGFKGGVALAQSEWNMQVVAGLGLALLMSMLIPVLVFFCLRRMMGVADAAATAATYGSISAVTFVTATSYLDQINVEWGGHLVAAMALMESPAIIIGLMMHRMFQQPGDKPTPNRPTDLLRESLLNGSVFLIVGSLVVGLISGPAGKAQLSTFVDELFIGILCLFLLDMGMVAYRRLQDMGRSGTTFLKLGVTGLAIPVLSAAIALALAALVGLPEGDALLFVVLCASASYIAVPAALRLALPEANPSVYLTMSLAVTFPFNLLIGIPLYHQLIIWMNT